MTYLMFLDDERDPALHHHYDVIARNYDEAINAITAKGLPKYISFDHDLGPGLNGLDVAKYMVDHMIVNSITKPFGYYVHSQNPVGRDNIEGYIEGFFRTLQKE
jgi:hypothetical protein